MENEYFNITDILLGKERVVYKDVETGDLFMIVSNKLYNLYKGKIHIHPHISKSTYNHPFIKLNAYPKGLNPEEVNLKDWGKEVYGRILSIKEKKGEVPVSLLEELGYITSKLKQGDKDLPKTIDQYVNSLKDGWSKDFI